MLLICVFYSVVTMSKTIRVYLLPHQFVLQLNQIMRNLKVCHSRQHTQSVKSNCCLFSPIMCTRLQGSFILFFFLPKYTWNGSSCFTTLLQCSKANVLIFFSACSSWNTDTELVWSHTHHERPKHPAHHQYWCAWSTVQPWHMSWCHISYRIHSSLLV